MSITFGPYAGTTEGALNAVLPRMSAVITPTAYAALRAEMPPLLSFIAEGGTELAPPVFISFDAMMPTPFLEAVGNYYQVGYFDAYLPEMQADLRPAGARLRAVLPRQRITLSTATPSTIGFPISLRLLSVAEFEAPMVAEEIGGADLPTADWAIVLQAIVRMADTPMLMATLQATLTSSVVAQDLFTVILQASLTDQIDVEDIPTSTLRMVYLLADQLSLMDSGVGTYSALVLVASAVGLSTKWTAGRDGSVDEEITIDDATVGTIAAIVELLSELEAEDALIPQVLAFASVEDTLGITSTTTALVAALAELLDTVSVGFRITTGDGDSFIGYSVNTRNTAVSEYDNYPFNSFAMVGGIPFGAGPDGIYRLEGGDDEGLPINASVYTGLSDFGSSQLKKMPSAWIGLTSDGDMVLKVVTSDTGKKKENWYRMKERPHGTPVDSRFTPAKGLNGRYWGFEIANIDGADFTLDSLKVWPLIMQRRYSGR